MEKNQHISEEEFDTIESYLLNNMTPDERSEIEARLSADGTFKAKTAELRLLMMGVNEALLQEQLDVFHNELPVKEKEFIIGRKTSSMKTWLVAASILLLASVTGWLFLYKKSSEESLFASYFKPDPGLISAMSATDNYVFERAMIDYKKGDYNAALISWDSLQKIQPVNDTLNYFLGVAHLANKNAPAAIPYLQKVTALSGSFFRADAYWYLGLAQLKEAKTGEAILSLEQSAHPAKARILERLKSR